MATDNGHSISMAMAGIRVHADTRHFPHTSCTSRLTDDAGALTRGRLSQGTTE